MCLWCRVFSAVSVAFNAVFYAISFNVMFYLASSRWHTVVRVTFAVGWFCTGRFLGVTRGTGDLCHLRKCGCVAMGCASSGKGVTDGFGTNKECKVRSVVGFLSVGGNGAMGSFVGGRGSCLFTSGEGCRSSSGVRGTLVSFGPMGGSFMGAFFAARGPVARGGRGGSGTSSGTGRSEGGEVLTGTGWWGDESLSLLFFCGRFFGGSYLFLFVDWLRVLYLAYCLLYLYDNFHGFC